MIKDEAGKRYGRLVVLCFAKKDGRGEAYWRCVCDCGKETIVSGSYLRTGHTSSCGCLNKERIAKVNFKGGHYKDRLYHVWMSMKQRCFNPSNQKFSYYGGRGITVCSEWMEYEKFRSWAYVNGYDDSAEYGKSTIDRIDVNGNYEPSNCRFVDLYVQSRNRRNVIARRNTA